MGATWVSWRVWAAAAIVLAACGEARAFYWHEWPGSLLRVEPSLISPPDQNAPGNPPTPPVQPPSSQPPASSQMPTPPVGPPVVVNRPPVGPPAQTPEPSTAVIGLVGLGALAISRKLRRKAS